MDASNPALPSGAALRESAEEVARYFDRLWPLLRSLTGDGLRRSLDFLEELVPLERIEVPSGTQVFDWTVPKEWVVREAYVVTPDGRRILDVAENNLHLANYAAPFRGSLSRKALDRHLHSRPEQPDAIPYITTYYTPDWGFCLPHRLRETLPEGEYEVVVDTDLVDGSMTIAEAILPGREAAEVMFTAYTCHPSMANDNLSAVLTAAFLYRRLAARPERRLTYRFVFGPETIGSIVYLARMGQHLRARLAAGYVLSCIGDRAPFTFKRSRCGESLADRAAVYALKRHDPDTRVVPFVPDGSDERQYCSPGFDLPVGVVARSIFSGYPQYHSSLDDRAFISFEHIVGSVDALAALCDLLERNLVYRNLMPFGEPQLGRRGLYPQQGGSPDVGAQLSAHLWLLNLADGGHDLLAIAERSGAEFWTLDASARALLDAGLIERADSAAPALPAKYNATRLRS